MDHVSKFWIDEITTHNARYCLGIYTLREYLASHWAAMWIFSYLIILPLLLIATAVLTAHERAIIADIQFRKGPRKIGSGGLLQPFSDAFKLLAKEHISVRFLREHVFTIAAWASFAIAVFNWFVIPMSAETLICYSDFAVLFVGNLSVLHIFSIIFAGWSSYSKYAILGSIRTTAQLVSYDVSYFLALGNLFCITKSLSIEVIINDQIKVGSNFNILPVVGILFLISTIAETSRHPFDLPEAEAELVSGYNVEYSSIWFAAFFLGEYLNIISSAILFNDLFFGQSSSTFFFILRTSVVVFIIVFIRSFIPRYRYDQLMGINWKFIIPILASILFYYSFVQYWIF